MKLSKQELPGKVGKVFGDNGVCCVWSTGRKAEQWWGPDPGRPGGKKARTFPPSGMECRWNSLPGTKGVHNKRTLKR